MRIKSLIVLAFMGLIACTQAVVVTPTIQEVVVKPTNNFIYGGYPKVKVKILKNLGYEVGYSKARKNPLWVAYKVSGTELYEYEKSDKPTVYKTDSRLTESKGELWIVQHADYIKSGFDRGHLAPAHAIGSRYGVAALRGTFLLTNICPQKPSLNRGVWRMIEKAVSDKCKNDNKTIWIFTGPIFDNDRTYIKNKIEVPDSFYKILIAESGGVPKALAFVIPQDTKAGAKPSKFLVSIDEIEALTKIDFLTALDDELEDSLEKATAKSLWVD